VSCKFRLGLYFIDADYFYSAGLHAVRPSVCLSVALIDICRRQRAAAASVLHCDPRNEDRAVFLVVRGRRSRSSEITSSVSAVAIDRVAILLLYVACGFTADLTAVVKIGQYVKYAKC